MKSILFLSCFFTTFVVHATDKANFDLRERLQFTRNSNGEVTFQYCKLSVCENLNMQPIGADLSREAAELPVMPTGIAKQLLGHACAKSNAKAKDYEVAGAIMGDDRFLWANCPDKSLQAVLSKAKTTEDYLISYDLKNCSKNGVATTSVKQEADLLRKALKELVSLR